MLLVYVSYTTTMCPHTMRARTSIHVCFESGTCAALAALPPASYHHFTSSLLPLYCVPPLCPPQAHAYLLRTKFVTVGVREEEEPLPHTLCEVLISSEFFCPPFLFFLSCPLSGVPLLALLVAFLQHIMCRRYRLLPGCLQREGLGNVVVKW